MESLKELSYLEEKKAAFEEHLEALLRKPIYPHPTLFDGARYMLLDGGKRLRPLFTIAIGETLGVSFETIVQPASALEMVHTYSLIHDDLPCMDNDDFRRGKPTLHRAFGEATALLIGDFLLTFAFETLSQTHLLSSDTKIRLITTLAESAGAGGMVGGQALDLAKSGASEEIARKKTGKLFQAAFLFGAICAKPDEMLTQQLGIIGEQVGLLYQLYDDLLDGDLPIENKNMVLKFHAELKDDLRSLLGKTPVLELLDQMIKDL